MQNCFLLFYFIFIISTNLNLIILQTFQFCLVSKKVETKAFGHLQNRTYTITQHSLIDDEYIHKHRSTYNILEKKNS